MIKNLDALTLILVQFPQQNLGKVLRLGTEYGGWNVLEDRLGSQSVCLCFGAGEDITFDLSLIQTFGCVVHAFDPTPKAIVHVQTIRQFIAQGSSPLARYKDLVAVAPGQFEFHPVGIWNEDADLDFFVPPSENMASHSILNLHGGSKTIKARCKSFSSILADLKRDRIDLAKLDVEGAEYKAIEGILASSILPEQLLVEFDEGWSPADGDFASRILQCVRSLYEVGYVLFHAEGWNFSFYRANEAQSRAA